MTSQVVVATALVALMLTGCLGGGDEPEPTPAPDPPGGRPDPPQSPSTPGTPIKQIVLLDGFDMTGCTGLSFAHAVPAATAKALLPDGFEPAEVPLPLIGEPTGQSLLLADLFQCTTFATASTTLDSVWYGHVYTFVRPPIDLFPDRDLSADSHEYVFQMLAGEDILSVLWPAAGYDTYNATPEIAPFVAGAPLWSGTLGDYFWEAVIPPVDQDQGSFSFLRYTRLEDGGHLIWRGNESFPAGSIGAGTLEVPADSPFDGQGLGTIQGLEGQMFLFTGASYTGQRLVHELAEPL